MVTRPDPVHAPITALRGTARSVVPYVRYSRRRTARQNQPYDNEKPSDRQTPSRDTDDPQIAPYVAV